MSDPPRITAVLGPTNTGKTHYAIERMLGYGTGVIGLPLRLLAREVYDRIVAARGSSVVALVTGEERIAPPRTQYWVCTVEAMPLDIDADFLAVDEIQLCADPERGHVFTDRLLHARGLRETVFLGSETMRGAIAALVPKAWFERRERFSTLSYTGEKKISRMPPRSAIVGFSVENLYAIAELLRRQKGGAAVVMGALSPRTRNAQVEIYQNGDVDYLVATDAIGMGLNLDIRHVAFSATTKFDGRRMRPLQPNELAQIAGRAGRHAQPGTFGVTGEARPLADGVVEAIRESQFAPVRKLQWRNSRLEFGSIAALIRSLEKPTDEAWLTRARESEDLLALKAMAETVEVARRMSGGGDVRRLWDVCRIPDFRGISADEHAALLQTIFVHLHDAGHVPDDWLTGQVRRIDRTEGDIDTLSKRLAYIRTWTYVAQRNGWVADPDHWRGETRAVEDRLSDALHDALTRRFVDRRTGVLMRRLKQKEGLVAEVNDKGEVIVEGEFVGRLEGFRFRRDKATDPGEDKALRRASVAALAPQFSLRADRFYNAPDTEIDFTEQGGLMWGTDAVGKIARGPDPMTPGVEAFVDEDAGQDVKTRVERRLRHFIDRKVSALFAPLEAMKKDETLEGIARGFSFRLIENLGIIKRDEVAAEVKDLDQTARGALRRHGVRFGQFTIFMPLLLKPAPTRLRLVLWAVQNGFDVFPESPPPGLVTISAVPGMRDETYLMSGYRRSGQRAIRIDMLERLVDLIRDRDARAGFEATPEMLSISGLTLDQFAGLMPGLGYSAERGEREKVKAAPNDSADGRPGEASSEIPADTPDGQATGASDKGGIDSSKVQIAGGPANVPGAVPDDRLANASDGPSPDLANGRTADAPNAAPADSSENQNATGPVDASVAASDDLSTSASDGSPDLPDGRAADAPNVAPADSSEIQAVAGPMDASGATLDDLSTSAAGGPPPDSADGRTVEAPNASPADSLEIQNAAGPMDASGAASGDLPASTAVGMPPDSADGRTTEASSAVPADPLAGGIAGEAEEMPAGTREDAAPEMEVFYIFRREPKRRGNQWRGTRREGQNRSGAGGGGEGRDKKRGEGGRRKERSDDGGRRRERGEGGGGRKGGTGKGGDRERGKGGSKRDNLPRVYSSTPKVDKDRIDPDNPFAAALMVLKDKK